MNRSFAIKLFIFLVYSLYDIRLDDELRQTFLRSLYIPHEAEPIEISEEDDIKCVSIIKIEIDQYRK